MLVSKNSQEGCIALAAEAKIAALYYNTSEIIWLQVAVEESGHPQPATLLLQIDNSIAIGIMNGTIKQRRSKAIDMRIYWLKDRVQQKMLNVHWMPKHVYLASCFSIAIEWTQLTMEPTRAC